MGQEVLWARSSSSVSLLISSATSNQTLGPSDPPRTLTGWRRAQAAHPCVTALNAGEGKGNTPLSLTRMQVLGSLSASGLCPNWVDPLGSWTDVLGGP